MSRPYCFLSSTLWRISARTGPSVTDTARQNRGWPGRAPPKWCNKRRSFSRDHATKRAEAHSVRTEAHVECGDATKVLVEHSETTKLAVVGKRGGEGFVGRLLGSVPSGLAAHSHCPTVVVQLRVSQSMGFDTRRLRAIVLPRRCVDRKQDCFLSRHVRIGFSVLGKYRLTL
ncbi:universal stress protein [Cryobacterium sp. Y11]|uniref:universal stress protein n=1 Tax=Cryobacterium sp. Y11 TaxID=2045016 RepID=UPI000CE5569D